ncbi:hypothetical protein G7Y89_g5060 [Cudoniella acicularis]|uniref:SAP domain-containing protein n=1 Tax=Cudoniella acicularis TaxID=354080 RepID=A0A8H4RQA1_9HELO|nr:hypothetical protein G7Y89_g5060 [Cudoniella acicularis]
MAIAQEQLLNSYYRRSTFGFLQALEENLSSGEVITFIQEKTKNESDKVSLIPSEWELWKSLDNLKLSTSGSKKQLLARLQLTYIGYQSPDPVSNAIKAVSVSPLAPAELAATDAA